MGAWHSTYANLLRTRFSALVAYAELLEDDRGAARELAQSATVAVFSRRKAPRDTRVAEIACREWMAAHAAQDPGAAGPAATVLMAIDGKDADGVRAILKKSTPQHLPEPSAEDITALRTRFAATASAYAVPGAGVNSVMAPAQAKHRSAMLSAGVGTVAAVGAVAVAGWFGLNHLPNLLTSANGTTPSGSASPSATALSVTWNPLPESKKVLDDFTFPECGETYTPASQAVNGITPQPYVTIESDPEYETFVMVTPGFVSEDPDPTQVLAGGSTYVITLDDKVVFTTEDYDVYLDLYTVNNPMGSASYGGMGFSRARMCDVQDERVEFEKTLEEPDWATATEEEIEAYSEAWNDFDESLGDFPAGTYKVYQISPIVFGEQLALGKVFASEQLTDLASLTYDISWTNLAQDPRVSPYCTGDKYVGDFKCDPPADVLKEVLTREVDPSTVDDTPSGLGISEPLEQVVEATEE
ncbi:hypothetical protein [Demequina sp.]|uniref:hypothetical protein n=1 Tax=Demequina sp. TaxID=2050685 RepID=UPI003D0D7EF2